METIILAQFKLISNKFLQNPNKNKRGSSALNQYKFVWGNFLYIFKNPVFEILLIKYEKQNIRKFTL